MTRGDVLRYNLAYALIRASKIVRGLRQALTERERYTVADHVVAQLKEHGDPWHLSEEARPQAGALSKTNTLAVNHETHRRPWLSQRRALAAHAHQNLAVLAIVSAMGVLQRASTPRSPEPRPKSRVVSLSPTFAGRDSTW